MDAPGSDPSLRLSRREGIPKPSTPKRIQRLVPVPAWLGAKLARRLALREQGDINSEWARRLRLHERVVLRMPDPEHAARAEQNQAALVVPLEQLTVEVRKDAEGGPASVEPLSASQPQPFHLTFCLLCCLESAVRLQVARAPGGITRPEGRPRPFPRGQPDALSQTSFLGISPQAALVPACPSSCFDRWATECYSPQSQIRSCASSSHEIT